MSYLFFSTKKLYELLESNKLERISDLALKYENELTSRSEQEVFDNMKKRLQLMKDAIDQGLKGVESISGMTAKESQKMKKMLEEVRSEKLQAMHSEMTLRGMMYALAVMNCNAGMGQIVASPTAGSAGVVPGAILSTMEGYNLTEDDAVRGMLTAGAVGVIIAKGATFSAAKAGCQAEIGASTAMAAAAISEMRGLPPKACMNAAALALKNMIGLACDPIGGLVEVPCVKRNAFAVTHAMTASDLAAAEIVSVVDFDEVLIAMNNVAASMPASIRETSTGGLAATPTGKKYAEKFMKL